MWKGLRDLKVQNEVIAELIAINRKESETQILLETQDWTENPIQVSIEQFSGIEINDFAVAVARTALWIAESQMKNETAHIIRMTPTHLPLRTNANIIVSEMFIM